MGVPRTGNQENNKTSFFRISDFLASPDFSQLRDSGFESGSDFFLQLKMAAEQKIAIVGSGIVGKSWAMIFASRGHPVRTRISSSNIVALWNDC